MPGLVDFFRTKVHADGAIEALLFKGEQHLATAASEIKAASTSILRQPWLQPAHQTSGGGLIMRERMPVTAGCSSRVVLACYFIVEGDRHKTSPGRLCPGSLCLVSSKRVWKISQVETGPTTTMTASGMSPIPNAWTILRTDC